MKYKIAIVDDHVLFAQSLKVLINSFEDYEVAFSAKNGQDLISKVGSTQIKPDIVLLDVNMPQMNGQETMEWLKENRPDLKVLVLTMEDEENTIIQMLKHGARGYVLKDIDPQHLELAFDEIVKKGFHYSEKVTNTLLHAISDEGQSKELKEREVEFLQLVCSERTYKQIAQDMFLSPKTIDGYREALFDKLDVRSRVGLVLYAIEHGIYRI